MLKIGLSSCSKEINESLFVAYNKAGIAAIEISAAPEIYPHLNYAEINALSKKYNVVLWSYHLPFSPMDKIDISSVDRSIRKHSVEYLSELIKKAGAIGIQKYIIHPSAEPIADDQRFDRMECSKDSLSQLAQVAKTAGGVMAVENLPHTCLGKNSDEIAELISVDSSLGVCFDTNHLLSEPFAEFINKVGNKIITTHVSDYDFADEKHWLPGEGAVNWNELYTSLVCAGYNGMWMYELGFKPYSTMPRSRNLTCSDFANNAAEIFAGKKLTVIK